ncbi:MAG: maleylpyruvate isomerase family mycothiol-dependent enzyme [Candidatus Nanopelagicales bacterium]
MPLDFVEATREAALRFGALAREVPHDLPVPLVRGWTVHHLVAHLTGDHEWALGIVTTREAPSGGLRVSRRRGDRLLDRYDEVTAELVDALAAAAADPDVPCPNFAQGAAGTLGWWPRHQAHEASVHLADLEAAAGLEVVRDPELSADGVDELFATYADRYPGQRLDRPLVLRSPGTAAWLVQPAGRGRLHGRRVDDPGHADLEADPTVLLLALWHRVAVDDPRLHYPSADADAVRRFLAGPLTA